MTVMRIAMTAAKIGRVIKKRDNRIRFLPARVRPVSQKSLSGSVADEGGLAAQRHWSGVWCGCSDRGCDLAGADFNLGAGHGELRAADDHLVCSRQAGADHSQAIEHRAEHDGT